MNAKNSNKACKHTTIIKEERETKEEGHSISLTDAKICLQNVLTEQW